MKEKSLYKQFLLFLMLFLWAGYISAQDRTITGKVTDAADGSEIPGVSVLLVGTVTGTLTDLDGTYSLKIPSDKADAKLRFSFIGYETIEMPANGNVINVALKVQSQDISEVIVIGYGTQKKSDKTGAVTSVTAQELNKGVLTDPIQGLQGKAAGVMISKKGGDPNSGFSVKIRGASGFGSGTEPLYVIDGVPGVDPTTIASEDIESFNILKDASSTAIYGARGANGIVIITTKQGSKKDNRIDFNSYVSIDNVAKRLDLLNADEIRKYVADNGLSFVDAGANTDWQDEIYQTGISQSHNINFSGGKENSTYFSSITHTGFQGVIKGTEKKRTIGRINLTQKALNNKLNVSTGLSGTVEGNKYVSYGGWGRESVLYQTFRRSPTDPVKNEDGTYNEHDKFFPSKNPVATIEEIQNERSAKRFLGNLKADLDLYKGLTIGTNLAYQRNDEEFFFFVPSYFYGGTSRGERRYSNYENKLGEVTIKYYTDLNSHSIDLLAGYSYQEENSDGFKAYGEDPASDYVESNNLGALKTIKIGDISSYKNQAKLISFFGRASYNYKSKYYLTATVRRDGSSKFGKNNEWGIFPSASIAWNIKQEDFMSNISVLSMLKLRGTYGMSGNQDIGLYLDQTIIKPKGPAINPETGETIVNFEGDKNNNPDLKWEENTEINVGLDYGFLNNRISGSIEYYNKTINDLLAEYAVPVPPNQYGSTWANAGKIRNSGIEFNLQAFVVDKRNFDWKTSFTFSTNKQEVLNMNWRDSELNSKKLYITGPGLIGGENYAQLITTGRELGSFYLPEYVGISSDGEFLFTSTSGGVTRDLEKAERKFVGKAVPDYEIGWSNQIEFLKRFELNFAFRAVIGYNVLNVTNMIFGNTNGLMPTGNVLHSALDEEKRGLKDVPTLSSYYLEDATFLRLDNITLAYNFKVDNIKGIEKARIYFSSNNTLLFTKYTGIDPEITYSGTEFGKDEYDVYPKTRTFTLGLNITF